MSTLALARSELAQPGRARPVPSLFADLGGEPTLDEMLVGVWEGLAAHGSVSCPVCSEPMQPDYGAHALPIGGRCAGCDSVLS